MRACRLRIGFLIPIILSSCGTGLFGQADRGSITGTVSDPAGAVIAAAEVTLTSNETGGKTVAQTSDAGIYNFPEVRATVYTIEAEAPGFKKSLVNDLRVGVMQKLEINFTLELGSVKDSVTVSGLAPLLTPSTSEIATNVSPREYQDLPVAFGGGFRGVYSLITILPGVNWGKGGPHISGSQANSRQFSLDGVPVLDAEWQGDSRSFQIPVDSIQEFSVITNNFSAEYGRTGGGVESYTVKSGTNGYHGELYEFLRNNDFDARGFYASSVAIARQNDFGVQIGGPVTIPKLYSGKDKTFFFFNYSGYRFSSQGANYTATVPDAKFKSGDFSEVVTPQGTMIPIYDPATTQTDSNGNLTRTPFPNNVIPTSRFSKVATALQSYFPNPTASGYFNNYSTFSRSTMQQDNYTAKLDHNFGSNHRISGSFSGTLLPTTPVETLPYPIGGRVNSNVNDYILRLSYDWIIRPTLVNHMAVGFNRYIVQTLGESNGTDWYSKIGMSGFIDGATNGFPSINIAGIGAIGGGGQFGTFDNSYNFMDTLSWQKGRHSLKFGFEAHTMGNNMINPGNGPSAVVTNGATAFPNALGVANTGVGYASFLLGQVYQNSMYVNDLALSPRWRQYEAYVQDDFKASSRLTLNLGLRYKMPKPWWDKDLTESTVMMSVPNTAAGNLPGALVFGPNWYKQTGQKSFLNTPWNELAPRAGLAYRLPKDTVFRMAYGIFYNAGFGIGNGFRGSSNGYSVQNTQAAGNTWESVWNLDQPYVANYPLPPFLSPTFANEGTASAIPPDQGKDAYIQSWSAGFQKQLRGNMIIEADYVGNKGTRLPSQRFQAKQLPPQYWSLGSLLSQNIYSPAVAAAGFSAPYTGFRSTILAQALSLYPQYQRFTYNLNDGQSTYDSAQVKVQKRYSNGLSFLFAYTLSKALTDTNSEVVRTAYGNVTARDTYNKGLDKSLSSDDRTHVFNITAMYELPFGPGKPLLKQKGPLQYIFGGWQVNTVLSYASGFPLVVSGNYDAIPAGGVAESRIITPNSVLGVAPGLAQSGKWQPGQSVYLNTAAWSQVSGYTIGTSPYILPNVRGFASKNENMSVFKSFDIKEWAKLQLRAEAYDIFNRFIPSDPNTAWNPTSVTFGKTYGQANGPRIMQFAAKLTF